jgi:chromosome segregation ATPase
MNPWKTLFAASALLVAVALPLRSEAQIFGSDPESLKRTDSLIKKAEGTIKQTVLAREEIGRTLDSYNALFKSDVADPRAAYKSVEKGIERCEKQRAEVRKHLDEMKVEAEAYFQSWNQSLQQISNQDLRKRSEQRMTETRGHFDGVLAAVSDARDQYEPFIANLKDQWTYLGHDLNPSGIASLKPDADKLNADAKVLFDKIDDGMKKAGDYVTSLRSSKPVS